MKKAYILVVLVNLFSCRANLQLAISNIAGDYTAGREGLQLRLYPDSTFYVENNDPWVESTPSWGGKWRINAKHNIILDLDTTGVSPIYHITSAEFFLCRSWSAAIVDANTIKIKISDSVDGPILKKGALISSRDNSEIYSLAHLHH